METPSIAASQYQSNSFTPYAEVGAILGQVAQATAQPVKAIYGRAIGGPVAVNHIEESVVMSGNARIIKVFIADPDTNMPLESRVLYTGEEKLTDLTDQELFFEVPMGDLLAKHNEKRSKTIDKRSSEKFGRDIYLEPARIRDLKMVVVTIAQF